MSEVMQHESDLSVGITLSESALTHILSYLGKQQNCQGVRLSVKKTGCSGLSYVVDYVQTAEVSDIVQSLDNNYYLYIDKASYPYLKGMHVDYVKQGFNSKFVFNNPNQKGQCGCGESFTVD
ncbi:HesB/IscA family protein [Legionella jordanis]|uniref:Fe-S cluster assembly protein n=1 Tax=Legionella jordanis TaxID=456 RepID=A0A0W0V8N8_9GAMM|nr:iron-sulfur cluster assembly accessory protein [Legionella jordanis]KTD16452.1 Fe-S cluster assembly protein [Legionella jordanis]RMX03997.1 iron-sulfur cluster assembly accessory protein [Legionella jordanis]RMX15286.1 iron-sulfur cluster assembly accessory protein [Legionella jordanis]VEH12088.1 Fe-S cluster assembly protein [Legionella jordanis]HAT8712611.1 iron-sulfur cluster assembly accessory protein [Legionella jordanis]